MRHTLINSNRKVEDIAGVLNTQQDPVGLCGNH